VNVEESVRSAAGWSIRAKHRRGESQRQECTPSGRDRKAYVNFEPFTMISSGSVVGDGRRGPLSDRHPY